MHQLIAASVPRSFQSSAVAIVTAASYGGAAFAAGIAPTILDKAGWPAVFYVFGASALLWLPPWLLVRTPDGSSSAEAVATSASTDASSANVNNDAAAPERSTSVGEADSLLSRGAEASTSTSSAGSQLQDLASRVLGLDKAFWGLARRKEVWAICAAQYCQSWGMYALLNWLPTFFSEQVRSALDVLHELDSHADHAHIARTATHSGQARQT